MEMNTVKYSAYRLALKLRRVQQRLCLDLLDLEAAVLGFDMHGLTPDRHDMAIEIPEMVLILYSIYETLDQEEPEEIEVPLCVELCLNWLLNVYDGARIGQVRVLAFKIGLLVLCRGPLTEKYLQMYKLVAGIGGKMRPRQLGILLFDCVQIPRVLGEIASFGGSNIEPSVRSCFAPCPAKKGPEALLAEIDVKLYLGWLKAEPQALVWLPVLHRLSAAEAAKHNAKCGVCKRVPITGFRYHCLKCFNFDLCHNCFFVGKTARGHKAEHPMREYCTSTGASVNLKNFGQSLRNSFRSKKYFKKKQGQLGYLPARSVPIEGDDFKTPAPSLSLSPNLSMESRDLLEGSFNSSLQPRIIHPAASSLLSSNNMAVSAAEVTREDEHEIIARLCREVARAEGNCITDDEEDDEANEEDVAAQIKELEKENRRLAEERDELKKRVRLEEQEEDVEGEGVGGDGEAVDNRASTNNENDKKKEAKELKQSTARMETRMRILADHNEQLEAQLNRLRQLLVTEMNADNGGGDGNRNFGTLQSKEIIAAELDNSAESAGGGGGANGNEVVDNRPQPPPSRQFSEMAGQVGKEIYELVTSLRKQNIAEASAKSRSGGEEDEDSLGLSDHETQRVTDSS